MVKARFGKRFRICKGRENLFIDSRGVISNHELTEPINLIGLIESKKVQLEQSLSPTTRTKMLVHKRSNYRNFSRYN